MFRDKVVMTAKYQMSFILIIKFKFHEDLIHVSWVFPMSKKIKLCKIKTRSRNRKVLFIWQKSKHSNDSLPTLHTQLPVCHFEWPPLKRNRKPRVDPIAHSIIINTTELTSTVSIFPNFTSNVLTIRTFLYYSDFPIILVLTHWYNVFRFWYFGIITTLLIVFWTEGYGNTEPYTVLWNTHTYIIIIQM